MEEPQPKVVVNTKKKESLSEKEKKDNARWILSYMENEEEEEKEEELEEATLEELNKVEKYMCFCLIL